MIFAQIWPYIQFFYQESESEVKKCQIFLEPGGEK